MTQPRTQHRREIWASLCIGYDAVSGLLWQQAIDFNQPVGTCSKCGQLMRPLPPETHGKRVVYPARCAGCGREVEGMGPRPEKPKKGG
jgi:predicted amidophosphoribosyltransferase